MVLCSCSMILLISSLLHSTLQMVRSPEPLLSTTTATTRKLFEVDKYTCPANFTMCRNLYCVSVKFWCDGFDDCGDGTDEENCDAKLRISSTCPRDKFKCLFGPCISKLMLCDGVKDCPHGGEDELGCPPKAKQSYCQKGFFQCLDIDGCIPVDWVCDGEADCQDASDERNCQRPHQRSIDISSQSTPNIWLLATSTAAQPCSKFSFVCGSGDCIAESRVCDGRPDCGDGSDEGTFCRGCLVQNGGCQEFCRPKPGGVRCSCSEGYYLMPDKKSCAYSMLCAAGNSFLTVALTVNGTLKFPAVAVGKQIMTADDES